MSAILLEGKKIAEKLQQEIAKEARTLSKKPRMVAIQVVEDAASELYLKSQKKTADAVGLDHAVHREIGASETKLLQLIEDANHDPRINGIMVQMPLPQNFDVETILDSIDLKKDVEGVTSYNLGKLVLKKARLAPSTALSCVRLIEETGENLYGKRAVIVGSSKVVGRPVSLLLSDRMMTTVLCNIATSEAGDLESFVKMADVVVVAVGKPNVVPGKWIKKGAVVIDVGFNRVNGKTLGDVEFEIAKENAKYITPVPGGVGPLTVTILMQNLVKAFRWQSGI